MERERDTELTQSDRIYDKMLTSAEINIRNRPCVRSYDNLGHPVSFLVIPTLEDLKLVLFEAGNLVNDHGYPRVTTMGDIESVAFLVRSPPGTIGSPDLIPALVSQITRIISQDIQNFSKECNGNAGTIKILDADGLTELSLDTLFRKYFSISLAEINYIHH
jgi:hypothetical protein